MKILITHIDLDGVFPNVLNGKLPKNIRFDKIYNLNYGFEETEVVEEFLRKGNSIVMVDLSISEQLFNEWSSILDSFEVYDHHESSSYLSKYKNCSWDTQRSGTKIFFEDFKIEEKSMKEILKETYSTQIFNNIEYCVNLVDCYDRWVDDSPLWKEATRLNKICLGSNKTFINKMIRKLSVDYPFEWSDSDIEIFTNEEKIEDEIFELTNSQILPRKDNEGNYFSIVEIVNKGKVSMVSSRILKEHTDLDYLIITNPWLPNMSFRSKRKDMDLTRLHGVFGHKLAAGGTPRLEDKGSMYLEDFCFRWMKEGERKSKTLILEKVKEGN